ncbi:MAG: helix-turn-helix transcriptional regulator [Clostridiales bacterium]|nr:helix-turn-helix transcriptional regulator [Clostridiales bacterium]
MELIGTKGIIHYPYYAMPINYYKTVSDLDKSNSYYCYKLVFIEEGVGSLRVNDKKVFVAPLTVLCINEKKKITDMEFSDIKMQFICFLPSAVNNRLNIEKINSNEGLTISDTQDKQFLIPFLQRNSFAQVLPLDIGTGKRLKDIFQNLEYQLLIQSDSWPCLTRSYLIELLFLVERAFHVHSNVPAYVDNKIKFRVEDVLFYIQNNYMNRISIEDLTKMFHTNRTTISRVFKEATGETIVSYMLQTRVKVAACMLRDTELKIEVIIERVGFRNITHFNKVFKKYMKCLPSEYRRMTKMQNE